MVQQPVAKAIGIAAIVQKHASPFDARYSKVIGDRPERKHQVIVTNGMATNELGPIFIDQWRQENLACVMIDALESAVEKAIAPTVTMAAITNFIEICVQRPCRNFMEQRLPNMCAVLLDEDDVVPLAPEPLAQASNQLEAARPTANHYNLSFALHARPPFGAVDQVCVEKRQLGRC